MTDSSTQTTHGCETREEYQQYLDAVDVLIGAKPSRFCIPVGYRVETSGGNGIVAQAMDKGYVVKMDESETCHHGVELYFTKYEVRKWTKQ